MCVCVSVCEEAAEATRGGDVAQFVERRTGTPPTQIQLLGAARLVG